MPKPPTLFLRCGSDTQFTQPVIGSALTETGDASSYAAGYFGNGVKGVNNAAWQFIPSAYFDDAQGRVGMWWKPDAGFDGADGMLFDTYPNSAGKAFIYIQMRGAASNAMRWYHSVQGGAVRFSYDRAEGNFAAGTWYHIAYVWDRTGIDGGADTARAYVNGVEVADDNNAWADTDFGGGLTGSIANAWTPAVWADLIGTLDNFKVYDYANTDFTDIYNERGGMNDVAQVG
jgi:hypothetical protein